MRRPAQSRVYGTDQLLRLALCTFAASVAQAQTATPMPPTLCVESQCPTSLPIDLDVNAIPWHTGAGPWGPQVQIQFPALPLTTRSVNVSTREQFNQAAAIPGTLINITTSWATNTNATVSANDIDVVLPAGVSVGAIEIGAYPRTSPVSRVRIRGPVPGVHSGGRMGQYRDFPLASDIVIDGIDINGDSGHPATETNQAFRASGTRIAILNTRAIAAGYIWLGNARHVIIANTNMFHGAATRASVGYIEGWGIRNTAGPFTIVDSRIEGTRYHNIRVQSVGGTGELLYVGNSTLVAVHEGRTAWLWNNLGSGGSAPNANGQGAIIENSSIYTYTAVGCWAGQEIDASNVTYSRIRNNRFFGAGNALFNQTYLDSQAASGAPGDHDWSQGNTFHLLTALPSWGEPGDPRQIPLPGGRALSPGESPCLPFSL